MIQMAKPKESFRIPLSDGSTLSMSVFPTKNDPKAEVVSIEVRKVVSDIWVTDGRIAVYRSPEGNYRLLPDREKPTKPIQPVTP